ncbi:MAG: heavy metal translocating P-type ATPase, partial [Gammaproteobacteria bacterium]|nr:heavy metal translocating P-type ATPase [Gammaproteobacteria bacterium]
IPLFYISMGYMLMESVPNWPLGIFRTKPIITGITLMVLALGIMIINKRFYISGIKAVINKGPNMDTLVALGSGIAFIYSIVLFILMIINHNDSERVMSLSMNLSFETAGMIPALITIGKTLESYSKGKTTNAIKSLLNLAPKKATLLIDGKEKEVDAETIKEGDTLIVKRGESFAVDGIVISGESYVNESMLTGESIPVYKEKDSNVSSGTINENAPLIIKATRVGSETTLNKIVEMVKESSSTKTKLTRIADKISGIFVPVVLTIALIVFTIWIFISKYNISYSLERAIAVIVVSCPCALGLATPVAIMVGNGKSAKYGILFKNAEALEETGKVNIVVLDKTGTITEGVPEITDIIPYEITEEELIKVAASLERLSEHPLSKAITNKTLDYYETKDFNAIKGVGIKGLVNNKECISGNINIFNDTDLLTDDIKNKGEGLSKEGKTPLFFIYDNKYIGLIALRDKIKEDSKEAIRLFNKYGLETIMLTGDNKITSEAIGAEVGVKKVISGVLPETKRDVIIELKKRGKVMMIGDGINDSIALTEADVSLAIGRGSDIAIDSANVVLMKSSLLDAVAAYSISRYTYLNILENLFWAFIYNLIMIPLAAMSKMLPWMGAAAMSLSSFTVCMNALRINLFNPYKERNYKNKNININSEENMSKQERTLMVEGMKCMHCVAHTEAALKKVKGVKKVTVSLEDKTAVVLSNDKVTNEELIQAVESEGFKVTEIK